MIFNYPNNGYPKLVEAVKLANKIIQDPKLLSEVSKVKNKFKDSDLTGVDVARLMKKHIDAKTPIYIRTFKAGRIRRWARRDIVNARVFPNTPHIIEYNSGKLYRNKLDIVETIIHEYVHSVDTLDPDDSSIDHGHILNKASKNYYCAPNTIGRIARSIMVDSDYAYSESERTSVHDSEEKIPEIKNSPLSKLNYIAIGEGGDYSNYGAYRYTETDLNNLVNHLIKNDIHRLAIYCHGGLVNETDGATAVEKVVSSIYKTDDMHAIGFIWKTGMTEVLQENLLEGILSGLGSNLMRILLPYIKSRINSDKTTEKISYKEVDEYLMGRNKSLGASLDDDFNFSWETNKSFDSQDDTQLLRHAETIAKQLVLEFDQADTDYDVTEWLDMPYSNSLKPEITQSVLNDFDEEGQLNTDEKGLRLGRWWAVGQVLYQLYKRKRDLKWHGAHATIVEEILRAIYINNIAKTFWEKMKQKAITMWQPGHPANQLLTMLNSKDHKIQIEFIGHSAGANCGAGLLNLLNEGKHPNVSLNHCILLAPATNYKVFKETYVNKKDLYNQFTMYALTDSAEKKDELLNYPLLKYFYPASLLYLVSGIMEGETDMPLAGMNRFRDGIHPYKEADFVKTYEFLYESNKPLLSPCGQLEVRDHGEFDNDDKILLEIRALIN